MIQFEDLDLICRVGNRFYKLVIDSRDPLFDCCERCALLDDPLCHVMPCFSNIYNFHCHYEEIPKETCVAMRLYGDLR